jgi:hypothetical protein
MLIAPFFRASVQVTPVRRALFARTQPSVDFLAGLAASPEILRQNFRRLFAAALLAQAAGGRLVLVEGFRSNRIVRPRRRERFVTGSWLFAAMLRAFVRRGLLESGRPPLRADFSRCTSEEAEAIAAHAAGGPVVGVTSLPCPSAARARRYLAPLLPAAEVLSPEDAVARAGALTPEQAGFWRATAPRAIERWRAPFVEAPNWGVHVLSEAARVATGLSLERALARALRSDR